MNWIVINRHCYNANHLQEFHWYNGALSITVVGRSVPDLIHDPDGAHYRKLCEDLLTLGADLLFLDAPPTWSKGGLIE